MNVHNVNTNYRTKSEKKDLDELFKSYRLDNPFKLNLSSESGVLSLIDIGGGDGCLTEELKQYFNLTEKDVLIVDPINNNDSHIKTICPETFIQGNYQCQMISCLMSIHHFNMNFMQMTKAIFASIQINGYLLIKEHDVNNMNEAYFLDKIHDTYARYKHNDVNTNIASYYSKRSLENYIIMNGFRLIASYSRTDYNPQWKYHSLFRKVSSKTYNVKLPIYIMSNSTNDSVLTEAQIAFLKKLQGHYEL